MNVEHYHAAMAHVLMELTATLATVLDLVIQDKPVQRILTNVKQTTLVILMRLVQTTLVLISATVKLDLRARTVMRMLMTVVVTPVEMEVSHVLIRQIQCCTLLDLDELLPLVLTGTHPGSFYCYQKKG